MAGKVAKVHVAKFPVHEFNASYLDTNTPGLWNMEQDEVLDQLSDESFNRRVEILEQLLITVRRNGGRLPYTDPLAIFNGLSLSLADSNWDVRLKCIQLINEVIPQFGDDLDVCMSRILGKLIPNIGESKITVRRAVIQTLHVYMKHTNKVQGLLRAIVQHGLENTDPRVIKETVVALPMLFTPDFKRENFYEITQSLAKKLLDNASVGDNLRDCALMTMDKIKNLVGEREFGIYIQKLSTPLKRYYCQLTGMELESDPILSQAPTPRNSKQNAFSKPSKPDNGNQLNTGRQQNVETYEFGIIPSHVMKSINDQENFKLRAQGVEELKSIVRELSSSDVTGNLHPHMMPFISFLNNLMDDSNFKITTVTLEILNSLVEKLGVNVKQFLRPLSNILAKRMGDNKIVVRQAVMRVATKMMQSYQAKPVLSVLCENLQHRNSRIRQETLNIVIAALLTFPSYDFDLPKICQVVAPILTDSKRQVRQAALECLAVIAQAMGLGKLQPLVHAVDGVELSSEGEGVMTAVQARLARRQLPKLNSDGLVEYATPIPSSASSRTPVQSLGADLEWIMAVGSTGSARQISRSDTMELESVTSSARSTPAVIEAGTPATSRRFMSAGRGRNKLPWEEDEGHRQNDGPPKPRNTSWSVDDTGVDGSDSHGNVHGTVPTPKRVPKRRITVVGLNSAEETAQQEPSSYSQMHLNKLKKNQGNQGRFNASPSSGFDQSDFEREPPPVPEKVKSSTVKATHSPTVPKTSNDESPIPLKPTLARSATKRSTKKVPPISTAQSDKFASMPKEDDSDSAYAASLESNMEKESHQEMMKYLNSIRNGSKMMKSLQGIRSSAHKKKEKVVLEKTSSQQSLTSRSPSPDFHESGIWSTSSRDNDSDASSLSNRSKKSKKVEAPFESRPKLARSEVDLKKSSSSRDVYGSDVTDSSSSSGTLHIDYNPVSGVTFRENRNSDVQVVGRGYSDDTIPTADSKASAAAAANKARRRTQKGPLLSPLGVASSNSLGSVELDDDQAPAKDGNIGVRVVGRGMFDSSNGTDHAMMVGNSQSQDRYDKKSMKSDRRDMPNAVVGVSMNRQGSSDDPYLEDPNNLTEDPNKAMSKAMKDRIIQAQKQKEEELERERRDREKKKQEHDEKIRKERERQQEKLRRLNTSESLGIESLSISGSNTPKTKTSPAFSPRKRTKPQVNGTSSHPVSASSSRSGLESENPDDWKPYRDPDLALRDANKNLAQEDWEIKCSGINMMRRLVKYHPEVVNQQLHSVIIAMLNEVKNLRSQVSRSAIVCIADMYAYLKKGMDSEVDITAKVLLAKNGESNGFIREDVEKALAVMLDCITPQRSLLALIAGGATHKNPQVRKTTSYFVVDLVDKMGPGRILSGVKDITDRVLPTAASFCLDGSPETRYNGRKIFSILMVHQDFDKMLTKHLPPQTLRNVVEIVDTLRTKGLGDLPGESSSARGGRTHPSSRNSSMIRGGSANSENQHASPKKLVRTDEATQEEVKQMTALISANDWRDRYKGITRLLEMCDTHAEVISANMVKIFDKFLPRLQDPNSKVNLYALQVFLQIIPYLSDSLAVVLNIAVGNVAPNLSSRNKEIYATAMDVIDALVDNIDGGLLIQPLANQAQSANARSKPDLVEKVAELVIKVYQRKHKQVILHVLPLVWHLLGATHSSGAIQGGSSSIRSATCSLVNALYSHMGNSLLEKATSDPNVTPRHLQLLQDLIER
ncbi:TOG array regulator of axonemal microtubules protein 1-like isoform X3 [Mizuhopecten yessoensis]|uniref:TOG array regulator of axonemal microtubules protein 1-like isoform X3 n=1 Tax=Mizuhopecten yessoensis TaxID=6573 RepID=UPI000B45C66F|nr:TOG array regulator of axonemal microtubules protein 1-like isoform X3 [Mizuhopecten yessoensis]